MEMVDLHSSRAHQASSLYHDVHPGNKSKSNHFCCSILVGTGKTTTLVTVLNSLHIRQYNKYYDEVRRIAAMQTGNRNAALSIARKAKPRLLVCAPSNAGVDNIILKIMEAGFVDGSGQRYNPSMIRVGVGQSAHVRDINLQHKVDQILSETDLGNLDKSIAGMYEGCIYSFIATLTCSLDSFKGFRMELQRISADIVKCRRKVHTIANASHWPLSKDWEIRVDESSQTERVFFVNHKTKTTSYEVPPPPEPGETQYPADAMPEYRAYMSRTVKVSTSPMIC
jgi:senataxin